MIAVHQLRDAIGLKGSDSIHQILTDLEKETSESYSYGRGRYTILKPEFFKTYFERSRSKRILPFSPKIISVANNKGGVGKTGVTALLAYKASQMGHIVLCIDTDPQANLTSYLLGEKFKSEYTLYDFFRKKCTLDQLIVRVNDYLSIIPSGLDNEFMTDAVSPVAIPKKVLSEILPKTSANLVLIDTNPTLSDANLAFHSITDMLIAVINNDIDSVKGFENVLSKLDMINYEGIKKLVFNKVDAREKLDTVITKIQELDKEKNFSISQNHFRTDTSIKKAQENVNGAINHIEFDSKCQVDALAFTVEILRDLSMLDNKELLS